MTGLFPLILGPPGYPNQIDSEEKHCLFNFTLPITWYLVLGFLFNVIKNNAFFKTKALYKFIAVGQI